MNKIIKTSLRSKEHSGVLACIYGKNINDSISLLVQEKQIYLKNFKQDDQVTISLKEKSLKVIIKEIQIDIMSRDVIHIDFYNADIKQKVSF